MHILIPCSPVELAKLNKHLWVDTADVAVVYNYSFTYSSAKIYL